MAQEPHRGLLSQMGLSSLDYIGNRETARLEKKRVNKWKTIDLFYGPFREKQHRMAAGNGHALPAEDGSCTCLARRTAAACPMPLEAPVTTTDGAAAAQLSSCLVVSAVTGALFEPVAFAAGLAGGKQWRCWQ